MTHDRDAIASVVIRTAAFMIGGYDDTVRQEELRITVQWGKVWCELTGPRHILAYIADFFTDRTDGSFDHTPAEIRSCRAAAKAIREQLTKDAR